jgi:cyclopropane-fatty-acyl-phospholipid synthase
MRLLSSLLTKFVQNGSLRLINARGQVYEFGGKAPGPHAVMKLHDPRLHTQLALNPELYTGEGYMDGTITFEDGTTIFDFIDLFSFNRTGLATHPTQQILRGYWRAAKRWHQANIVGKAAENARAHYDIKTEIYRLFLDEGMNYSCAFFEHPETDTLEEAQTTKLERITAKLMLEPGMTVAEIGSGWGSQAITIAKRTGAKVTAMNVSPEQLRVARERAVEHGVDHLVDFVEMDYRLQTGKFDRVVSVGMMEHVGIGHFDEYFNKIKDLLKSDGWAMIHCIGRSAPPGSTGPFIRKYIFPGAYVPSLSEVYASLERTGLWVGDMETLRLHYHYTLQHWRKRFAARREEAARIMDERFCRMWEYYLAAVDVGFSNGSNMVFQLILSPKIDGFPIVRDPIVDAARVLKATRPA